MNTQTTNRPPHIFTIAPATIPETKPRSAHVQRMREISGLRHRGRVYKPGSTGSGKAVTFGVGVYLTRRDGALQRVSLKPRDLRAVRKVAAEIAPSPAKVPDVINVMLDRIAKDRVDAVPV